MFEGFEIPSDTDSFVGEQHRDAIRKLSPEQRLLRTLELSDIVRQLMRAGIRQRHPSSTEAETLARLAAITLGEEVAARYFGWRVELGK